VPASALRNARVFPLVLALTGLSSGAALQSQSPAVVERIAIARAASRVAPIDSSIIRRIERRLATKTGDVEVDAERRLERGWVRLRLAEMGDRWSAGRAAGDFTAVVERFPDWTLGWIGLGDARRREAEALAADPMNLGSRIGFGKLERALSAYETAARLAPTDGGAVRALYETAVLLRDTTRMAAIALPLLRAAAAAGSTDRDAYFALGRAERLMGDIHASVRAFQRYLDLGGDPGRGLRDLAWSAYVAGDSGADSAYAAGAQFDDTATVAGYREDLELIATDEELARFDLQRGAARVNFLDNFWHERDRASLRTHGERIREHFRRMTYAERHYGLEVNRRHYALDPTTLSRSDMYRSGSTRFDDRGIVYIRQGPPDDRVFSVTYGIQPNESWVYARANGDLLLHFAANTGGDIHDLRLINSVTDIGGVNAGDASNPATLFAFLDRCKLHRPYCKYLNWSDRGRSRILRDEQAIVSTSTLLAVSTDAHERHFASPLAAQGRGFAVGTEGGKPVLHLAFAVGLERPPGIDEDSVAFLLPLAVRVNLTDSLGRSAGWIDTTSEVLLPGGGGSGAVLSAVGRVSLPMQPGKWYYQMALAYRDTIGVVLPTDTITVRSFSPDRLAVSDLVLSRDRRGARWVPAVGDTAWMNPRTTWAPGDVLSLYHEVYGLEAQQQYRASLILRRGKKQVLTLAWDGAGQAEVTRVTRTLSLERVPVGDYVLELEIFDSAGRKARSATPISLRTN
jgi:hypothetical protein